jgi:hypothetical protein
MSSFARSTRFVVSVISSPFLNCWLRKKPKIFDALGFLRSQNPPLESQFYKAFGFLRSTLAMRFQELKQIFRYPFGHLGCFYASIKTKHTFAKVYRLLFRSRSTSHFFAMCI